MNLLRKINQKFRSCWEKVKAICTNFSVLASQPVQSSFAGKTKIQMFTTSCRSLTLPIHGLFKSLALYTWKMLESLFSVLLQSINIPCFHYNSTSQDISKHPHNKNDALEQGSHYSENWFEVFLWTTITILLTNSSHGFFTNLRIFFMKF